MYRESGEFPYFSLEMMFWNTLESPLRDNMLIYLSLGWHIALNPFVY